MQRRDAIEQDFFPGATEFIKNQSRHAERYVVADKKSRLIRANPNIVRILATLRFIVKIANAQSAIRIDVQELELGVAAAKISKHRQLTVLCDVDAGRVSLGGEGTLLRERRSRDREGIGVLVPVGDNESFPIW